MRSLSDKQWRLVDLALGAPKLENETDIAIEKKARGNFGRQHKNQSSCRMQHSGHISDVNVCIVQAPARKSVATEAVGVDLVAMLRNCVLPSLMLNLALVVPCTQACVIRLAYNEVAAPPYYYGDGGRTPEHPGPAVELVDLAATKLGCKIAWQRKPLKRIVRELESNDIDATIALSYSTERAAFLAYPMKNGAPDGDLALWTLSYDFYVRRGSTLKWDGKQFNRRPESVGANAGYSVVTDLKSLGIATEEAPGDLNNLTKLLNKRIEVYAGQSMFVDQLREQPEFAEIERLAPPYIRKDYFLVFSHGFYGNSADTVNRLWKQIAELKKSQGDSLFKKYQALFNGGVATKER